MACRSCDLKRVYKLFEEKKRREAETAKAAAEAAELAKRQEEEKARLEAEEAEKRARKKTEKKVIVEVTECQTEEEGG